MGTNPIKKQVAGALELMLGANGRKIKIVEKFDDSFQTLKELGGKDEN